MFTQPFLIGFRLCLVAATVATPAHGGVSSAGCHVRAHLSDPDIGGTNVRAGPSPSAPILIRLPHDHGVDGDGFAPELEIICFERGWAKVRAIRFADYGSGAIDLFAGSGWVSGKLLTATLTRLPSAAIPKASVPVVATAGDLEDATVNAIDDCVGAFAHVSVTLADGQRVTGWTDMLCANQVTTCS